MNKKCLIIAELSANHGGDIEVAKETIREQKEVVPMQLKCRHINLVR